MIEKVLAVNADYGVIFDTDVDRAGNCNRKWGELLNKSNLLLF